MRLGAYQTLVDLGRGGMADLYVARGRANEIEHEALVILKTLRPPTTEKRVEMFLDEARLGLLFSHPNVVRTLQTGEEGGRHFIAMEFLDGQPVDRILHRAWKEKEKTEDKALRTTLLWILAESLAGLHYAHDLSLEGQPLNIVHRDFTPQNIFVTYDGRVKALDFGIAKAAGRMSQTTTTGEVKGKVRYMAPEQALGLRIDRRADVFAAGVLLFELCSRGVSFWKQGLSDKDVFEELVGGEYPVELEGGDVGNTEINRILAKALARDASERYRTADEMRVDLIAEIERHARLDDLRSNAAALVSDLFHDQRGRTAKMIANAHANANANANANAAKAAEGKLPTNKDRPHEGGGTPIEAPARETAAQRMQTMTTTTEATDTTADARVETRATGSAAAAATNDPTSALKRLLKRVGISVLLLAATPSLARAADEPQKPNVSTGAETTTTDAASKQAEQHFKRGLKLFDEGDFKLALVEFERSYELVPNYRVLYNIGEVQFQLNNYANALRTLTRYVEVGADRITPNRKAEVDRDIESLRIRTAHVRVSVDVEGADVLIDGERIGRSPLHDRELVDAGTHRISAQKVGFTNATEVVTLVGGDDKALAIHLVPAPVKEEGPRVIEVRESEGLGPVWIGWGLTVALGVATVGTAVAWQNADGKLTDLKGAESSPLERTSQASTVDTLRTATFVVGGATLVTAGVSFFFTLKKTGGKPSTTKGAFGPRLDAGLGRVVLSGSF